MAICSIFSPSLLSIGNFHHHHGANNLKVHAKLYRIDVFGLVPCIKHTPIFEW